MSLSPSLLSVAILCFLVFPIQSSQSTLHSILSEWGSLYDPLHSQSSELIRLRSELRSLLSSSSTPPSPSDLIYAIKSAERSQGSAVKEFLAQSESLDTAVYSNILRKSSLFILEPVKTLLATPGVSAEGQDSRGWTPLHWAVHFGFEELFPALLAAGSPVLVLSSPPAQQSILHLAVGRADTSAILKLQESISDSALWHELLSLVDGAGRSPLDYAIRANWSEETMPRHLLMNLDTITDDLQNCDLFITESFSEGKSIPEDTGGWLEEPLPHHPGGCPGIDRIDISVLTPESFYLNYVATRRPLIIENATTNWKARDRWRWSEFGKLYGHLEMLKGSIPYAELFSGGDFGFTSVSSFQSYMRGKGRTASDPLYVFDTVNLKNALLEDWDLPSSIVEGFGEAAQYPQFMFGPRGAGAPVHHHCHAVNGLVYGRKLWWLFPPAQSPYSKMHPSKWFREVFPRFDKVRQHEKDVNLREEERISALEMRTCVQEQGELIYVPIGWGHGVYNLKEGIGVAVEFETGEC